jgi:hypothetical protein
MSVPVLDLSKNWFFHFGGLVKNEVPLKLEEKSGVINFVVYLDPNRIINIELTGFNENKSIIEGHYALSTLGNKEKVNFQVLKPGKLVGHPTGIFSRDVWTITSEN